MRERIFTNWSFTRVLYIAIGAAFIFQAAMDRQWFGIAFGGYFAAMGIFSFGCAAGKCYGNSCDVGNKSR